MKTNGNSDAFASEHEKGLSKREYFAGLAMAGLFAYPHSLNERVSVLAVKAADALIEELNKPKNEEV